MRRWILVAILLIIILALVVILYPRPSAIEVVRARRGNLEIELFTTGVVESEMADVAPRIVSTISRLLVREGQPVQAQQEIAILDRSELVAQADEARAALGSAQAQVRQAEEMVGVATRQGAAAVARAQAGLQAARARLADIQRGAGRRR